ncbi:hypothetical protein DD563_06335 [Pelagicola sp. LXJ1103]|nr:hypothetical protein DD563_06335 [Pelagicola sp. LXJ1103]
MSPAGYAEMAGGLRDAMRAKLGVRAKSLRVALRRAGRTVPAPARAAGQRIVQAEGMVGHPKLRRLVDGDALRADAAAMRAALGQIDPKDRRRGAILGMAGGLVFNLLLALAGLVVFLIWRGYL